MDDRERCHRLIDEMTDADGLAEAVVRLHSLLEYYKHVAQVELGGVWVDGRKMRSPLVARLVHQPEVPYGAHPEYVCDHRRPDD